MKIFDTPPREGMPVRHPSFFKALTRMAKAWETLCVDNGHVSWSNGVPKIIIDGEIIANIIPECPEIGDYVLMCKNGVQSWVALETFVCPEE